MNRHQDLPGLGNAIPASLQSYDVELLKETGCNYVRCSHYPMHPAFLDACDRLGILVYEEIASWQHVGGELFARNARQMMAEMISRDRHHPSIIFWGLLNEGRSYDLFKSLHETAHRHDPWRMTVYAENEPEKGMELGTVHIPDVIGLNYKVPHLDELREVLKGIRLINSEHSNANIDERGGKELYDHSENELWQMEKVLYDINEFSKREWMAGSALWCMHDYGTDYEPTWPMHESGVFDAWRVPKSAAWGIRARWAGEPFVRILGHWTWPGWDGRDRQAVVVSNCADVELFLNDASLGTLSGEVDFRWDVAYQPGTLRAVAKAADGRSLCTRSARQALPWLCVWSPSMRSCPRTEPTLHLSRRPSLTRRVLRFRALSVSFPSPRSSTESLVERHSTGCQVCTACRPAMARAESR